MKPTTMLRWAIAGLVAAHMPLFAAEKGMAQSASVASFQCRQQGNYYTIAIDQNGKLSDPVIVWTTEEFSGAGYTPERRCREVTGRLNELLEQNNDSLSGLYLTAGRVNGQTVLCSVNNTRYGCNSNNMLFTLSGNNARNPNRVLQSLADDSQSSGNLIQESGGQVYVDLESLVNRLF